MSFDEMSLSAALAKGDLPPWLPPWHLAAKQQPATRDSSGGISRIRRRDAGGRDGAEATNAAVRHRRDGAGGRGAAGEIARPERSQMELDRRAAEFASFDEDSDVDGAATDEMEPSVRHRRDGAIRPTPTCVAIERGTKEEAQRTPRPKPKTGHAIRCGKRKVAEVAEPHPVTPAPVAQKGMPLAAMPFGTASIKHKDYAGKTKFCFLCWKLAGGTREGGQPHTKKLRNNEMVTWWTNILANSDGDVQELYNTMQDEWDAEHRPSSAVEPAPASAVAPAVAPAPSSAVAPAVAPAPSLFSGISRISRGWSLRNIEYTQPLIHRFLKTPPVVPVLVLMLVLVLVLEPGHHSSTSTARKAPVLHV